jgi:phosphodiesterase/alkaline phosphatase D-like protein
MPISNRGALIAGLLSLSATAALAPLSAQDRVAPQLQPNTTFSHGPLLGNVTSNSIRVWARTKAPGTFEVLYSTSPDLSGGQLSAPVTTTWEHDAAGWAELTGLTPGTRYYYALVANGGPVDTRVGDAISSFRTLPDASAYRDPQLNPAGLFNFAFEIGTGNNQGADRKSLPPTYRLMRENLAGKIDFQIQNGDWIYEEGREVTAQQWVATHKVGKLPRRVELAQGITGNWENYRRYLDGSADLANFYRDVPLFVTLDDHEILNDVIGSGEGGFRADARGKPLHKDLSTRTDTESDVERAVYRDPAEAAWDDYVGWSNPHPGGAQAIRFGTAKTQAGSRVLTDPSADFTKLDPAKTSNLHVLWGFGNTGVYTIDKVLDAHHIQVKEPFTVTEQANYSVGSNRYTKFRVGNADIFLLDARSNRTLQEKYSDGNGGAKSMVGATEKAWLERELQASDAQFVFIVSSVNLAVPHDNGVWAGKGLASQQKDDGWTAQITERAELLKLVESLGKPVFFLTGDLHKSFVARIAPGVYDVATGPHTSLPHRLADAGGAPPSGWYQSGDRLVNILWSSNQYRNDSPRQRRAGNDWPIYTVVKVNNAYNVPDAAGKDRWIAYPEPQVIFEFHDGYTGDLVFAHSVSTSEAKREAVPVSLDRVKLLGAIKP